MSSRTSETSPSRSAEVDTGVEHSSTTTPKTAASSPTSVTAVAAVASSVRRDTNVETVHDKEDDGSVASSSSAPTCRFCLDEEGDGALGPLVSPCRCAGGQRYVHEACLRRWQRTVAASSSSSSEDDRGAVCRVCATPFSIAPPTREELVASIVGPVLAGEVREGALVAASPGFSRGLSRDVRRTPAALRRRAAAAGGHAHWYGAVLLVVAVGTEDRTATLVVDSVGLLGTLRGSVVVVADDDDRVLLEIPARRAPDGRARRLAATASPRSAAPPDGFARWFLRDLTAADLPVSVSLRPADDDDDDDPGRDDVVAVNLVRPIGVDDATTTTTRPAWAAATRIPRPAVAARVRVPPGVVATHCVGGPCEEDAVRCCLVPGGPDGWTIVRATDDDDDDDEATLRRAMATAERRVARKCPAGLFSGRPVVARGLTRATELNGRRGVACRYRADDDRWSVRLEGETERRRIRAANLEPTSDVLEVTCAWGCARWSRSQLLGEIARGSWGLCRADAGDVVERPDRRRANCEDRLTYAPRSEMSDDYARLNDDDDDDDMEEEDEATRIWLDDLLELNDVGMDEAEEEGDDDDDSVDDNMNDYTDEDDTESDDRNDDMEDEEESLLEEDLSRSSNDQNDDVMEEDEEDTEEEDLPLVG